MNRERALQVVLTLVGLIFLVGVYPLMMFVWPSGWRWQPHQPEYEQMILGVYATLGIFLLIASRRPAENRSLIAFTAWSSLVHAGIMTVQALHERRRTRAPAGRCSGLGRCGSCADRVGAAEADVSGFAGLSLCSFRTSRASWKSSPYRAAFSTPHAFGLSVQWRHGPKPEPSRGD